MQDYQNGLKVIDQVLLIKKITTLGEGIVSGAPDVDETFFYVDSEGNLNFKNQDGNNLVATGEVAASIAINKTAWIETVANGGNDATAAIGDPALPFATMQAAYDHASAPRTFYLGQGTHAGITTAGNIAINILGLGDTVTTVTLIKSTADSATVNVKDLGVHTFLLSAVGGVLSAAASDTMGVGGNSVTLQNVKCTLVNTGGQPGGNTSVNENPGSNGGSAGSFSTLGRCTVGTVLASGGIGGTGYDAPGGAGGSGGACSLSNGTVITNLTANGGATGTGFADNTGGAAGGIVGKFFEIIGTAILAAGYGNPVGSGGTVDITNAYISTLDGDGGAGDLVITAVLSRIDTTTGAPTVAAVELSKVNGVIY